MGTSEIGSGEDNKTELDLSHEQYMAEPEEGLVADADKARAMADAESPHRTEGARAEVRRLYAKTTEIAEISQNQIYRSQRRAPEAGWRAGKNYDAAQQGRQIASSEKAEVMAYAAKPEAEKALDFAAHQVENEDQFDIDFAKPGNTYAFSVISLRLANWFRGRKERAIKKSNKAAEKAGNKFDKESNR